MDMIGYFRPVFVAISKKNDFQICVDTRDLLSREYLEFRGAIRAPGMVDTPSKIGQEYPKMFKDH